MERYLTVSVTAPNGSQVLEMGITSTPERHVVVDQVITKNVAGVYLVLSFEREEICKFDTEVINLIDRAIDVNLDIPEGATLYVGFDNESGSDITQNVVIGYHLK